MLEHGAYRLLLDRYYGTEQGIQADQVHRLARARSKEEKQAVDDVLNEFFDLIDGIWKNKRADEEIAKAQAKIAASKENGKKGGRPKLVNSASENETQDKPTGFSLGLENETQENPQETHPGVHQSPDTRHQLKPSEQPPLHPEPESREKTADVAAAIPDPPTTEGHWLTWFNRETGSNFDPGSRFDRDGLWPIFRRWCDSGIRQGQVKAAIDTAYATATTPIANLPKYVAQVLSNSQASPRISHSDASKLAAARAIFGTEIEGENRGSSERIIDATPVARLVGG